MRISILGAARTGRTRLCADLVRHFQRENLVDTDWLVTETSAMTEAVTRLQQLGCSEQLAAAVDMQRSFDFTLVCGLDLPHPPPQPTDCATDPQAPDRSAYDALLRAQLMRHSLAFRVIYGRGTDRLHAALRAIGHPLPVPQVVAQTHARLRNRSCDRCSDPGCEHRLFAFVANRADPGTDQRSARQVAERSQ